MVCSSSEVYIYWYYFALQILAGYTNMTSVMAPSLPPLFINFVSTSLLALLPGPLLTLTVYKICVHDEKMIHDTMVCIKTKPFNFFIAINFNSNTNIKRMTTVTTVLKCFIYVCV